MLAFVAIGLDHTTAGIELRERLAFADGDIPTQLRRLTGGTDPLLDQAAILSTCHRIELYGIAREPPAERRLAAFLAHDGADVPGLANKLYVYRDDWVAHRLAETAAGVHSLVLGEAQIQGQVRKALDQALAAGTAGPELRRLFESAIAAGRRVRSETAIARGMASLPGATVAFACRRHGTLDRRTVLVVGTGETAELSVKHLVGAGVARLLVHGRTPGRADRLAQRYGGQVVAADALDEALAAADVVISATAAATPVLSRGVLERALARRAPGRVPLLVIDLAVPRDVDPGAATLPGVEVHTIDDLRHITERAVVQRRAELPHVYAVLGSEVARFTGWLHRREAIARVQGVSG